jgi:hypothetical protein
MSAIDPLRTFPIGSNVPGMTDHSYIRVRWLHSSPDNPVELLSELDARREEVRKIEIWAGGRVGHASHDEEVGGTRLGDEPIPSMEAIAADPQFKPEEITRSEFDSLWKAYVR